MPKVQSHMRGRPPAGDSGSPFKLFDTVQPGTQAEQKRPPRLQGGKSGNRSKSGRIADSSNKASSPVRAKRRGRRRARGDKQVEAPSTTTRDEQQASAGTLPQPVVKQFGTITYLKEGNQWSIKCEPHVSMKMKKLFGKIYKGSVGEIKISATDENSRDLEWFMQRYPMVLTDGGTLLTKRARSYDASATRTAEILTSGYSPPEFKGMALPPRDYQRVAADLALHTRGLLVADELGLGKSVTAITMLTDPRTLPAVIVCPTHLPNQWKKEINRFMPHLKVHITKKKTPYAIDEPDVIITNYHKVSGWADYLAKYVNSVVFDEVQELRTGPGTSKYDAAQGIAHSTDFRIDLSATPIYNYGGEFYAVLDCISPGALGDQQEFLREWCTNYSWSPKKARITNPKAFGTYLRETGKMLLRTKTDVGRDLPKLNKIIHEVEANLGHLDEIKTAATELAKFIVNSSGASGLAVMQASSEFSNKLRQSTGIAKAPFVAEFVRMLIESTDDKVVLFGWHREVYRIWESRLLKYNPAWYTGTESPAKKQKEIDRFINDPDCKVLIMSLRSGSGVDGLQNVASRVVIGELDWSPGALEQCVGRVYRDGQIHPVFAYYLTALEGADPVMVDVLGLKQNQLAGVKDPSGQLVVKSQIDPNHVKKLAAAYLKQ